MRNLHIGGEIVHKDWELFNIEKFEGVDHVGNAADMSRFEDETFDKVYASHILEHFDYNSEMAGSLHHALAEWKRVLKKGGKMFVAVPNLDRLCGLFLDKTMPFEDRMQVVRMIFGGHTNEHNYHYMGFDKDLLLSAFVNAGFKKVWQVKGFGFFDDSSLGNWQASDKIYTGLSINFVAEKE